ncbi:gag-protease polyprotein [Trifolium pratense]|uniref:Gag-protease polyprotein n=1 Tax=Trifolium pratense TaxID=57577 RepID=A0A2K3JXY8_TRIPR|nr:gag-protease polyprotein [Trifolium pratense]
MMDKNSRPNKGKGVQCHDCESYGHVKAECPTFLKIKRGGMSPTYSDKNSERECDDNTAKRVMAFTGKYDSDNESYDGEVTYEELADSYRELYFQSEEICRVIEKQKVTINHMKAEKIENMSKMDELQKKVNYLTSDLDEAKEVKKN